MADGSEGGDYFPDKDYPFRGSQQVRHQRFAELREDLMFDLDEAGVSPATLIAYWGDLDWLLHWCLDEGVDILAPKRGDLARHLDELRETGYSLNTIARKVTSFRHFYRHLVEVGVLATNPMTEIHQRRPQPQLGSPSLAPPQLTARQRRRLLAAAHDHRDLTVVSLLLDRVTVSQLCRAVVGDLRDDPPSLRTRHRGIGETILLSDSTLIAVHDYLARRRSGPLIVDAVGRPIDRFDVRRLLARLGRQAGIRTPVTPHRLPQPPDRSPRASRHTSSTD